MEYWHYSQVDSVNGIFLPCVYVCVCVLCVACICRWFKCRFCSGRAQQQHHSNHYDQQRVEKNNNNYHHFECEISHRFERWHKKRWTIKCGGIGRTDEWDIKWRRKISERTAIKEKWKIIVYSDIVHRKTVPNWSARQSNCLAIDRISSVYVFLAKTQSFYIDSFFGMCTMHFGSLILTFANGSVGWSDGDGARHRERSNIVWVWTKLWLQPINCTHYSHAHTHTNMSKSIVSKCKTSTVAFHRSSFKYAKVTNV